MRTQPGGRFMASSVTLRQLILEAFAMKDYQVEGGPKWLTSDFFSINASAGAEATRAEINVMLQALLAERFALKTHVDTRQAPTYALTLARSDGRLGPAMKPTSEECLQEIEARKNAPRQTPPPRPTGPRDPRELLAPPTCGNTQYAGRPNGAQVILTGGSDIRLLVSVSSNELGAPVIDRTGLTGLFTFTFEFTPERIAARLGLDPGSNDVPPSPLGIALEKQLGLKLEKQLGPLPFLVIDAAEHPTPD